MVNHFCLLMFRQGDLLIKLVDSIPGGAKKVASGIILYGESTGHKHRLVGGNVMELGESIFLSVGSKAKIVHEEHEPIHLTKGKYAVIRQREYQSKDMTKLVID